MAVTSSCFLFCQEKLYVPQEMPRVPGQLCLGAGDGSKRIFQGESGTGAEDTGQSSGEDHPLSYHFSPLKTGFLDHDLQGHNKKK